MDYKVYYFLFYGNIEFFTVKFLMSFLIFVLPKRLVHTGIVN